MKPNMGTADRLVRTLIALVIVTLFLANILTGTLALVLMGFAGIFLFTSFVAFCPLYTIFGIKTCPSRR